MLFYVCEFILPGGVKKRIGVPRVPSTGEGVRIVEKDGWVETYTVTSVVTELHPASGIYNFTLTLQMAP